MKAELSLSVVRKLGSVTQAAMKVYMRSISIMSVPKLQYLIFGNNDNTFMITNEYLRVLRINRPLFNRTYKELLKYKLVEEIPTEGSLTMFKLNGVELKKEEGDK